MIFIGGAATFSGAVTLGVETTDTVTISGTATLTVDLTVVNDAYFIAAVTFATLQRTLSQALLFSTVPSPWETRALTALQ